jgi:hypothetical protein
MSINQHLKAGINVTEVGSHGCGSIRQIIAATPTERLQFAGFKQFGLMRVVQECLLPTLYLIHRSPSI